MSSYIYGEWRGKPARKDKTEGGKYWFENGNWYRLGLGYDTEFKPFAEELSSDSWEQRHTE